jgi:hypothetical protein
MRIDAPDRYLRSMNAPYLDHHECATSRWPDVVKITDTEAAKLLLDPRRRPHLAPFLSGHATVSEAAALTGQLPNSMLASVRRFLSLGLIEVTGTTRRSGKQVRSYRAIARTFFIRLDTIEDIMLIPETYWQKVFNDSFRETLIDHHYRTKPLGTLIKQLPNGTVVVVGAEGPEEWVPPNNGPLVYFDWSILRLNLEQAKALQRELDQMVERYRRLPAIGRDHYLVGAHMTPLPENALNQPAVNDTIDD